MEPIIQTIGQYWRCKRDWEIMSREVKKRATELENAEYEWSRTKMFKYQAQFRQEDANKIRELGFDLGRLQGKVMKLTHALGVFDGSIKEVPIEIDGGKTDGR